MRDYWFAYIDDEMNVSKNRELYNHLRRNRGSIIIEMRTSDYLNNINLKAGGLFYRDEDNIRAGIDPKILNLVVLFNAHGIETMASCEGHLAIGKFPNPWINFESFISKQDMERARELLRRFNEVSEVQWRLVDKCIETVEKAKTPDELKRLQRSATDFAGFLYLDLKEDNKLLG